MSKSIRARLLRVVVLALLLLAIVMSTGGIMVVNRLAATNSERIMTRICNEQSYRHDGKLNVVQHSVEMINEYVNQVIGGKYVVDSRFLEQNEPIFEELALSVANQTQGAMAIYFRYDPDITGDGTSGFFWTRESDNEVFEKVTPTDILAYGQNDVEHVGWFYIPRDKGESMWMTPYYNQNLDIFMISYVIPVYTKNGNFVGIIGMDIDFSSIMAVENSADFYEHGILALVDLDEHLMYYTDKNGAAQQSTITNKLYNHITTINKNSNILKIANESGNSEMICSRKISNGMVLYVNVPASEIYKERNIMVILYIASTIVMLIFAIFIVSKSASAIIEPIKKLSEITSRYAQGDWSEKYINKSSDEIQILSEGISIMADNTQEYINRINKIARRDVLTGLGNKTAYVEMVEDIKINRQDKYNQYVIFVMDLNLLKKANDNYGHEAGDALLREAGKYISRTFKHSAVFRIGGDEFVTIISNEDYDNRKALIEQFEQGMGYIISDNYPVQLYISFGGAEYGVESNDYDTLFKIADDRMYAKKKEMKMERKD